MNRKSRIGVKGVCNLLVETSTPDAAVIKGFDVIHEWRKHPETGLWFKQFYRENAYVDRGLHILLNRAFRTDESQIQYMFISTDSTAVTGSTITVGGSSVFNVFSSTPTAAASKTISASSNFSKADIDSLAAAIRKIGMATTSTDAGTGLVDVIGGTGLSPYNEDITIDLLNADNVTLTPQIDTILTAT